uniref:ACT domain-containing protein n=1 Tax=Mycena chlorophos TaxID=658473 RepID=A0ABQ0LV38_MYCCL|nr:predicted protein [Mycena chlorophos]
MPTRLLFAIASDDPEAVRRVLKSGEVGAEEMPVVAVGGPEGNSAIRFTLENTDLARRGEIARVLAAFGAEVGKMEMEMAGPAMSLVVFVWSRLAGTSSRDFFFSFFSFSFFPCVYRYFVDQANDEHV